MIFHLIRLINEMFTYNKQNRLFLTSIIILLGTPILTACSKLEQKSYEEGARFIDESSNVFIQNNNSKNIKLTTSYIENEKRICIYIDNNTKKIIETSENNDCPAEI